MHLDTDLGRFKGHSASSPLIVRVVQEHTRLVTKYSPRSDHEQLKVTLPEGTEGQVVRVEYLPNATDPHCDSRRNYCARLSMDDHEIGLVNAMAIVYFNTLDVYALYASNDDGLIEVMTEPITPGTGLEIPILTDGTCVTNTVQDFRHNPRCSYCGAVIHYPYIGPLTGVQHAEKPSIVVGTMGKIVKVVETHTNYRVLLMGDMELDDLGPHTTHIIYRVVFDEYPDMFFEYYATWNGLAPIPEKT